ncbi:DUF4383 domain-containing protein [Halopelagius fulvigenes]|uniref:DUF4383 domain-containing protein n=1 Tax=Halopelagius fulvigenes TaxID=1198324 RepID=A0ABD5U1T1_9EURY
MADEPIARGERRRRTESGEPHVQTVAREFAALNFAAGLLTMVGPTVENDDDGLVNTDPGLFLGAVAVNGRHSMLHVTYGAVGLLACRTEASARAYLGLGGVLFAGLFAAGWRAFGFERGVHLVMGMAMDGWGNLAHALLAAFGLRRAFDAE